MEEQENGSLETKSTDQEQKEKDNPATEVNQDELIMAQEKKIADEIKASTPMVGPQETLESLQKEYAHDSIYSSKVTTLLAKYSHMRRTRPDGNCFLRGFIFAYLEYCINHKEELQRKWSLCIVNATTYTLLPLHLPWVWLCRLCTWTEGREEKLPPTASPKIKKQSSTYYTGQATMTLSTKHNRQRA